MKIEFNDATQYAIGASSKNLTSSSGIAFRWSEITLGALRAAGVLDDMVDGTVVPTDPTVLWLDESTDPAVLKRYSAGGGNWVPVTRAWFGLGIGGLRSVSAAEFVADTSFVSGDFTIIDGISHTLSTLGTGQHTNANGLQAFSLSVRQAEAFEYWKAVLPDGDEIPQAIGGLYYKVDSSAASSVTDDIGVSGILASGEASVLHAGAVLDDAGAAVANAQALRNVMDAHKLVRIPGDGVLYVEISSPLLLKNGHTIVGSGGPAAPVAGVDNGASKIILSGTGSSGWENLNPASNLLYVSMENLAIEYTGSFTNMASLMNPVGCNFLDVDWDTPSATMNGLVTAKIGSNPSWQNTTRNFRIRLPNGSTGSPWDVDFGDSTHTGLILGGGATCYDRATGGNKYNGGIWNNHTGARMTFTGSGESGSQNSLDGVQIEEGVGAGGSDIVFDGDALDPANGRVALSIKNCLFRSANKDQAINLINTSGVVRSGIHISGNVFSGANTPAISIDETRWDNVTIEANNYRHENFDYRAIPFTPELADADTGGNVAAFGAGSASYYILKDGEVSIYCAMVDIDTTGLTAGNDIHIRNLPLPARSLPGLLYPSSAVNPTQLTFTGYLVAEMLDGQDFIRINQVNSTGGKNYLNVSGINSGATDLFINMTYLV